MSYATKIACHRRNIKRMLLTHAEGAGTRMLITSLAVYLASARPVK